jgi:hypothetical protein
MITIKFEKQGRQQIRLQNKIKTKNTHFQQYFFKGNNIKKLVFKKETYM